MCIKLPPTRTASENRLKYEIDDIASRIIIAVNESGEVDKLPRCATDNLRDLPLMKIDESGLSIMLSKIDALNDKIDQLTLTR